MSDTIKEWVRLALVMGPASTRAQALLDVYGSPRQIFEAALNEDLSCYLSSQQLERLQLISNEQCDALCERCEKKSIRIVPYASKEYPRSLMRIEDPPIVLYATGKRLLEEEEQPSVGLVGSRRPSAYGIRAASEIASRCAEEGICLISGLADGLDSEAHKAAVESKSGTIAFLGCGIDMTYPVSNSSLRAQIEQIGTVFSEYGPGEGCRDYFFLQRNRLIAACSDALCVVEARIKSGTMNTVEHAYRYGVPVFAVPGSIFSTQSSGTNRLLSLNKAKMIESGETLIQFLGINSKKKTTRVSSVLQLNETDQLIVDLLKKGPLTLSGLCEKSGLQPGKLLAQLTSLEMKQIVRTNGALFTLK